MPPAAGRLGQTGEIVYHAAGAPRAVEARRRRADPLQVLGEKGDAASRDQISGQLRQHGRHDDVDVGAHAAALLDSYLGIAHIAYALDEYHVRTLADHRLDDGTIGLAQLLLRCVGRERYVAHGRPHRPRHKHLAPRGIGRTAGGAHSGADNLPAPLSETPRSQRQRIAAKRVGGNDVCPGIDIAAVQSLDRGGIVHSEQVAAAPACPIGKHGARSTVERQYAFVHKIVESSHITRISLFRKSCSSSCP